MRRVQVITACARRTRAQRTYVASVTTTPAPSWRSADEFAVAPLPDHRGITA